MREPSAELNVCLLQFEGHRSADWITLEKSKCRGLRCGEVATLPQSVWVNGVSYGPNEIPEGKGIDMVMLSPWSKWPPAGVKAGNELLLDV